MRRQIAILLIVAAAAFLLAQEVWAEARMTPVEVKNVPVVQISPLGNDVKAFQVGDWYVNVLGNPTVAQAGAWNVGISNTPNVSVTNTPTVSVSNSPTVKIDGTTNTVKASQSGTWTVGVSGTPNVSVTNIPSVTVSNTPSVSVSNTPSVKIDATGNTVRAPAIGSTVQLWATDQVLANFSELASPAIDCTGYRDLRFMGCASAAGSGLSARIEFYSPVAGLSIVSVNQSFAGSAIAMTTPVYSTAARVVIYNNLGYSTTINRACWVYLLN